MITSSRAPSRLLRASLRRQVKMCKALFARSEFDFSEAAEAAEARSAALPRDAFAAGKMCDVPKTLESTSAPASSETGTYRLHLGHRDPGSTLLIHAEPLQYTRAPRSARDARRALQCASPAFSPERGFSQQPLQLRFSVNGGALAKNVSSRFKKRTFTFGTRFRRPARKAPRSNAKLRASVAG